MAFDESKDKVHESMTGFADEKTRILVEICQYNGGVKKLQLKRENRTKEGWTFSKLGRLTGEEFTELTPVALELLDRHDMGVTQ